ncbi:MAG TPA: hypothetical protein EYM81_06375 [Candidatus Poseidoniales archaeon]|nr:hypothetical protein [Candidatus Poseidoniales archaeon]HIN45390.1 hypothetical protein [Candidatus Poseidoniales archaeon]HIO58046.1 hypothetical protein [Candidatus Poseidoniales archaeon]
MRYVAMLFCMLMMCSSLSGCLGGPDVETSEGDPVELGESTDDWPTYYVLTSADLPACPGTNNENIGKLYYVEADVNFQVCMSTGWQVVQLGGSGGNILMNQPPLVEANVWLTNHNLVVDDGDGTYSILLGLHWNSTDTDGTISLIGIDYDGDLTIDIPLLGNTGAYSAEDYTTQDGEVYSGFFAIPFESGLSFHRGQTPTDCKWSITRTITVMAVDDDGATSFDYITSNAFNPVISASMGYLYYNAYDAMDFEQSSPGIISQADYDWIMGVSPSTCPAPAVFSLTFDSGAVSSGDTDTLGVLTLVSGAATNVQGQDGCNPIYIGLSWDGQNYGQLCSSFSVQFSGTDAANPVAGDTYTISEASDDVCNPTNICDGIYVDFNHDGGGDQVSHRIYAS